MRMFQSGLTVRCGHVTVRSSFVVGQEVVQRGRCPIPLLPEAALNWAIDFDLHGYHEEAEKIFADLCAGLTVYRY